MCQGRQDNTKFLCYMEIGVRPKQLWVSVTYTYDTPFNTERG